MTVFSHGRHMFGIMYLETLVHDDTMYYSYHHRGNFSSSCKTTNKGDSLFGWGSSINAYQHIFFRLNILKCIELVDFIIGIVVYKVYHGDIPRVLENWYTENHNIHDYATRKTDFIRIAHADTNRHHMTMRFQGGIIWKCVIRNEIYYNDRIYNFKCEYTSCLVNCYTWGGYLFLYWYYAGKNVVNDEPLLNAGWYLLSYISIAP